MQKMLHTMLRVGDMQRSINFYTQVIGMRVLRTLDQPTENYTLTFLGFSEETDTCVLELTYNHGISEYDMGNAYGHIAISVDDCSKACADIKSKGGKVILEPKPLPGSDEIIAFVIDPDGYQIELIHRPAS
ncbi:MAG: lactoylglutathione lyase [Pseudomonadota bacterium]